MNLKFKMIETYKNHIIVQNPTSNELLDIYNIKKLEGIEVNKIGIPNTRNPETQNKKVKEYFKITQILDTAYRGTFKNIEATKNFIDQMKEE